jgi:hypothetical protein
MAHWEDMALGGLLHKRKGARVRVVSSVAWGADKVKTGVKTVGGY